MTIRRGTLASRLQPQLVVIVAIMAALVIVSTAVAARAILYSQLDAKLSETLVRQGRKADKYADVDQRSRVPGSLVPGMQDGTVIARAVSDYSHGALVGDGQVDPLDETCLTLLLNVPGDLQAQTLSLPDLGRYRVLAKQTPEGLVVVGLPVDDVNHSLLLLVLFSGGVGLVAVGVTALATRAILTSATKPLVALSQTAHEVSTLEMARGTVAVPRVDTTETAPASHDEVSRLSLAFNQMLGRVETALSEREASEAKLRRFVADASHELRNPLAAIRGYAELAERAPDADAAAHALSRIGAESKRMTKLVNDLLLLARLDADTTAETRPVDVVEVALNAVSDAQAISREHRWVLDLPEQVIEVLGDPDQLHQVMVNLLSNARTHTPEGTTVTCSVRVENGQAVIRVADNGPGIDQETQQRVFERFIRADDSRAHSRNQSTGLGLAIVKAVVEGFGGNATVTSQPGDTVFTISLPLHRAG